MVNLWGNPELLTTSLAIAPIYPEMIQILEYLEESLHVNCVGSVEWDQLWSSTTTPAASSSTSWCSPGLDTSPPGIWVTNSLIHHH